jgi:hypothetical protein
MKGLVIFLTLTLSTPLCALPQQKDLAWLQGWFNAWELVDQELLSLPAGTPPLMVFYDDTWVYTTSQVTAPTGSPISGPGMYGQTMQWWKVRHNDTLTLPDGQRVPVGLMTFAAATREGKSFFVMAAPVFWKNAGIESSAFTLEQMLTGVFLHEFTHTRQQNGFGKQVDAIEREHTFNDIPLTDDIVQNYFKNDSAYVRVFREEVAAFYAAAFAPESKLAKEAVRKGLDLLRARQAAYFKGDRAILKTLDDIFLSMEGLGQYVAVYWLMHPQGGNVNRNAAIAGFRRKRNQWSQEEGLAMFLALTALSEPDWRTSQFSERPYTIVDLLERAAAQ